MATQVRVGVRIRPLTATEHAQGGKSVVAAQPPSIEIGKKRFTYDALFDSNVTQGELFGRVAPPLLASFLEGYNATIMAYGQTGSGKTFTMGSEAHNHGEDTAGIIPRFMESVFHTLKQKKLDSDSASEQDGPVLLDYSISASFLEVYGEDVHDLLDKERKALPLRDDSNGGVVVAGLKRKMVSSAQEALDVLHVGTMNRTTAATLMNLTSSRSHAVFSVYLDQTTRSKEDVEMTTSSKFTFVDLAGSERMKKTGAEGERAREGIKINEGLLALGNVINALGDEERLAKEKKLHVPYRQSKLTRLLQDALGGNSQTFFMACVSPSDTNTNETLSTLRYANRARNIKNAPTKNIDSHTLEIQRLLSLNSIFLSELVKHKFGGDTESLARIDKTVLQQTGVMEYVARLQREAEAQDSACVIALPSMASPSCHSIIPTASYAIQSVAPNKASTNESPESMDETILEDMNPEEELAILDQLLELQQKEHDYDNEHKEGQLELKRVEGELEEQEIMLLQLKDSLKAYHSMKDKFEILMAEVQQLETEKSSLAVELENAKVDPTKGCSTAIQKKLARIEANLVRARSDARKQQKKCKEAERQAQKCKSLEQKIMQLKQGKANVVKRQRESTARHRQYTESKTREIISLKKKSRTADRKVSKLQAEVQAHKNNLAKRKTYTDKLTSKLKESEKHLMKLLSVRKRDLKERSSLPARRHASAAIPAKEEGFATEKSQELKTIKYFLDRIVTDRNASIQLKIEHDEKVAKYSDIMRKMVAEVKGLDSLRVQLQNGQIGEEELLEAEQAVEDLEVNLELIGGELEILRSKMSATESSEDDILSSQNVERKAKEMIANLASPTLRTLLWGYIDKYSSSELEKQRRNNLLERKDAVIQSLQQEASTLTDKVSALSQDISTRYKFTEGGADAAACVHALESQLNDATTEMNLIRGDRDELRQENETLKTKFTRSEVGLAEAQEKLTLAQTISRQNGDRHQAEETLDILQRLWKIIGTTSREREETRLMLMSSLEDTCRRKVEETRAMKKDMEVELLKLDEGIRQMASSLGISIPEESGMSVLQTLSDKLAMTKEKSDRLKPKYAAAMERKSQLVDSTKSIMATMELSASELPSQLAELISSSDSQKAHIGQTQEETSKSGREHRVEMMHDVANLLQTLDENMEEEGSQQETAPVIVLNEQFLAECEKEVSSLRLLKSKAIAENVEVRDRACQFIQQMNITPGDLQSLMPNADLPAWWNPLIAEEVTEDFFATGSIVSVKKNHSKHMEFMKDYLADVAEGRKALADTLKTVIDRAQRTLLSTVGEEVDASEAYASFHDALFKIPSLSSDHICTCINEVKALTTGVEAMVQSEIEALTVVWEALGAKQSDRSQFWGVLEQDLNELDQNEASLFDTVPLRESWVQASSKDAAFACRILNARLFKLDTVHQEVERLRSRQEAKSRIISLDSEIRILSTSMADFEEKKCNKERLLTKKAGSSTLLKEERFRKQMQGKFVSKLEQLVNAMKVWKESDEHAFDGDILSEEVRSFIANPEEMDSIVERRTEFMHLRTVKSKMTGKRSGSRSPEGTPMKRSSPSESSSSSGSYHSTKSMPSPSPSSAKSRTIIPVVRASSKRRMTTAAPSVKKVRSGQTPLTAPRVKRSANSRSATVESSRKRQRLTMKSTNTPTNDSSGMKSSSKDQAANSSKSKNPGTSAATKKPQLSTVTAFSPNTNKPKAETKKRVGNRPNKRQTIMPFSQVFDEDFLNKENP